MDINAIKKRLSQLKDTNTRTSNLWKPEPGTQQVRIVPYKFNKENPFIYDLRSSAEFGAGTVAGAMNIQPSNLIKEDALFKAGEEDCIILICKNGTVSSKVSGELKKQGYINVNVLSGGIMNWTQSGMPLVKAK